MPTSTQGAGAPRLLCTAGGQAGRSFPVPERGITLGRVSANDVCIVNPHVSRRHARVVRVGGECRLVDLKSRNRTLVNGCAVQEHLLAHGDEIQIADHRYVFLAGAEDEAADPLSAIPAILADPERHRTVTLHSLARADGYLQPADGAPLTVGERGGLHRHVAILQRIATTITADASLPVLLRRVAEILVESFAAERAFILVADAASGELRPAAAAFRPGRQRAELPLSRTIIERVAADRASFLCRDAAAEAGPREAASVPVTGLRSVMCTPLLDGERLRGIVYLDDQASAGGFGEEDLWLLTAIASHLVMLVESSERASQLRRQVSRLREQVETQAPVFVGSSPAFEEVLACARAAADSNATVLILGQSGTGKEVLARCIHHWSERRQAPFVAVNCAALSDQLLQSDLFGHERGAFTGAVRQKKGRLELADGGTVLLDEIGEMAPELQAKLLRFLEERTFERVGGTQSLRLDVRVIAATNKDLAAQVRADTFREDLYYRLRVVEITMPPLRRRSDDIPLLAEKFLADYALETGRDLAGFTPEALALLREHDWPGNIRELRNAIERAVVFAAGPLVGAKDLQLGPPARGPRDEEATSGFHDRIRQLKRQVIQEALEAAGGVQSLAAARLGLRPSYLSRLMRNLDLR